jgi:hypothetical protein
MALALVATLALIGIVPTPAMATPPVKDDGQRIWSVRPATLAGKPDDRTHFTLQGTPGSTLVDTMLVTNLSKATVSFNVYGTDAYNTPTGAFDLLAFDRHPIDIGSWIHFAQPIVTIAAGKSLAVPFNVVLPPTATPGDHAGGVVVSLASNSSTPGVNLDSRVAVRVYLRVPGDLRPSLAVTAVSANYHGKNVPFADGSATMSYTVTNPGNIRLRSKVTLEIKNAFGQTLAKLTPPDLPELLPSGTASFKASFTGIPAEGPLTANVTLAPYPDPLQPIGQKVPTVTKSGYFWAMPWTLLLIILLLLVILIGAWILRRRVLLRRIDTAMAAARRDALETVGASQ